MKKRYSNRTQAAIFSVLTGFLLFILLTGSVGIIGLDRLFDNTLEYIEAVDIARKAQMEIQKQFTVWKQVVLEGDHFDRYRDLFHRFSYHSTYIQNDLFNLKMSCSSLEGAPVTIEELIKEHKNITGMYYNLLLRLEKNRFTNKREIISLSGGRDQAFIKKIDTLVESIEKATRGQMIMNKRNYVIRIFLSLMVITLVAGFTGIYSGRRLMNFQRHLESRVEKRTAELSQAKNEVEKAYTMVKLSEEKYRILVEGSHDIIFTLDNDFKFISINRAVKEHFKIQSDEIVGKNIVDLIHDFDGKATTRNAVNEKLQQFMEHQQTVQVKMPFKSPRLIEPKELNVRLEMLDIEGHHEIIGKGSPATEDDLLQCFLEEKIKYRIRNSLVAADDLSYRITRNLYRYMDKNEIVPIRIGLREMLINAIEHGNLEVSFEEKSRAMIEERYFSFIAERQEDEKCRSRMVTVESSISNERAIFIISDEGKGFDHKKIMDADPAETNEKMLSHGRGISMAKTIFDRIRYNEKGNTVMLIRHFHST